MRSHGFRDDQHHTAGDRVADRHQRNGRKRFERHANAQVSGAPENAYACQSKICLKLWMISQPLGTIVTFMILTLTINPAIDRIVSVDKLVFEDRAYILDQTEVAGGRGVNASVLLHRFGGKTIALLTSGGAAGERMEKSLAGMGFPFEVVRVRPESRA